MHLKELYSHMQWAGATVWRAVLSSSDARQDDELMDTLLHMHETQHAFVNVWLENPFERWKRSDFESRDEMCEWARRFHARALEYLESVTRADLDEPVDVPWGRYFEDQLGKPPAATVLGETIYQVVSHSMHHRGQISRRLSQLNENPPLTDFMVWLWMGRPQAEWP